MDVQPIADSVDRRPAGVWINDSPDGRSQGARMRALLAAHDATAARRARWARRWERVRARWDRLRLLLHVGRRPTRRAAISAHIAFDADLFQAQISEADRSLQNLGRIWRGSWPR